MPKTIDLDSYFQRIDYGGPVEPTFEMLNGLIRQHMAHIPFEAIDVMLGCGIALDPTRLQNKLIHQRRGGYCFEHAGLFRLVLERIGFSVRQHLGRVWLRRNPQTDPAGATTHTSLRVYFGDEAWLVDVGFGSFMPTEPIPWKPDTIYPTEWGSYGLIKTRNGYMLRSLNKGAWLPLYEILDLDWQPIDYAVANHYVATHPDSHFRYQLNVARTTATERRTISGNLFRRKPPDGPSSEQILNAGQLEETLIQEFDLTPEPEWQPMLQAIAADKPWSGG